MARTRIEIDKKLLTECCEICSNEDFSRTEVIQNITQLYNNQFGVKLSPALIANRIDEYNIEIKYKRSEIKVCKSNMDAIISLKKSFPSKYIRFVREIAKGNLKSAIAAKCMDCSNFSITEIRECRVVACPLYTLRPYMKDGKE